jgi:hypothetical protein
MACAGIPGHLDQLPLVAWLAVLVYSAGALTLGLEKDFQGPHALMQH